MKLVAALLRVATVTAGPVESNGSLPPGLWLMSPAGWLPRTGISSGTLRSVIEYGLPLPVYSVDVFVPQETTAEKSRRISAATVKAIERRKTLYPFYTFVEFWTSSPMVAGPAAPLTVSWSVNWFVCILLHANAVCKASPELSSVDKTKKNWLPWQRPFNWGIGKQISDWSSTTTALETPQIWRRLVRQMLR